MKTEKHLSIWYYENIYTSLEYLFRCGKFDMTDEQYNNLDRLVGVMKNSVTRSKNIWEGGCNRDKSPISLSEYGILFNFFLLHSNSLKYFVTLMTESSITKGYSSFVLFFASFILLVLTLILTLFYLFSSK